MGMIMMLALIQVLTARISQVFEGPFELPIILAGVNYNYDDEFGEVTYDGDEDENVVDKNFTALVKRL